eukprot:1451021-Alexandrium_andersonii.AAC.1
MVEHAGDCRTLVRTQGGYVDSGPPCRRCVGCKGEGISGQGANMESEIKANKEVQSKARAGHPRDPHAF